MSENDRVILGVKDVDINSKYHLHQKLLNSFKVDHGRELERISACKGLVQDQGLLPTNELPVTSFLSYETTTQ